MTAGVVCPDVSAQITGAFLPGRGCLWYFQPLMQRMLIGGYAYIERLEKAHVEYDVFEDRDNIYSRDVSYVIRIKASDLKKVS